MKHLQGKGAINPYHDRNVRRMEKRRATWNFVSKMPVYEYDPYGNPVFVGFTKGVTYRKKAAQ